VSAVAIALWVLLHACPLIDLTQPDPESVLVVPGTEEPVPSASGAEGAATQ
jgi:hypothetical protein